MSYYFINDNVILKFELSLMFVVMVNMFIIVYCFYYEIGKEIDYILIWFLRVFKY